jgi:hypothetical protein
MHGIGGAFGKATLQIKECRDGDKEVPLDFDLEMEMGMQ